MRFTSSARRAAGLLAVSTIGLSTAVLGVTGIASAEVATPTTASAAPSSTEASQTSEAPAETTSEAPAETTTEAPAGTTTEAPAGTTTESPAVSDNSLVPGAAVLQDWVTVGDATAEFQFTPDLDSAYPDSWEYQLDGGEWTAFTEGYTGSDDLTGTLSGLTNLHQYSLKVRGLSGGVAGAESNAVTFTPYHPVAAPSSVSASVGVTSIRISWTPAADPSGTVAYEGFAIPDGAQSSADLVVCTTADATATSCTVPVKAGLAYGFGVHGIDVAGNLGDGAYGENPTAVVPASATPSALPTASAPLTNSDADGKVSAGDTVTVTGGGYLPGSNVEIVVFSTPVSLGTVVADAAGKFSATVVLPKDLVNGTHHLVASGVDADGNPRYLVSEILVSGGSGLAYTGFTPAPYLAGGLVVLLAGAGLLFVTRRRAQ